MTCVARACSCATAAVRLSCYPPAAHPPSPPIARAQVYATSTSPGSVEIMTLLTYQRLTVDVSALQGAALYAGLAFIGAPLLFWRRAVSARAAARAAARKRA